MLRVKGVHRPEASSPQNSHATSRQQNDGSKFSSWCPTMVDKGVWRNSLSPVVEGIERGDLLKHLARETRVLKEIPTVREALNERQTRI